MKIENNGIVFKVKNKQIKKAVLALVIAALSGSATTATSLDGIPALGEYWPSQGGINHGYFKGRDGQPGYYLVAAIGDGADIKGQWGNYGTEIAGAASKWDGKENTDAMASAGCDIASKVKAFSADGHSDFYMAAHDEYHLLKANADEHWKKEWYWTSTQYAAHGAWAQYFGGGGSGTLGKGCECRARAVRRVYV